MSDDWQQTNAPWNLGSYLVMRTVRDTQLYKHALLCYSEVPKRVKNRLRRTRCPATTQFSESFNSYHMFSTYFSDLSYIVGFHHPPFVNWDCLPVEVTRSSKKLSLEQLSSRQEYGQFMTGYTHTQLTHSLTVRNNLSSWACVWTVGRTGEAGQNPKEHREKVKTQQGNHKNTGLLPY